MGTEAISFVILGALVAAAIGLFVNVRRTEQAFFIYSVSLLIAALIYLGFAAFSTYYGFAGVNWLAVEMAGIAIYSAFAFIRIGGRPVLVPAGWLLHVAWDAAVPHGSGGSYVPEWYAHLCIGFDIVFALLSAKLLLKANNLK